MAAVDRPWKPKSQTRLNLDPDNQVASAVASQETWSGLVVSWPVDDSTQRLPVELSGLPVFDRDRVFRGYRGFGVCRDIDCINEVARERREGPADILPGAASAGAPRRGHGRSRDRSPGRARGHGPSGRDRRHGPVRTGGAGLNRRCARRRQCRAVSIRRKRPLRSRTDTRTPPPLSPIERRAFRELAHRELTARLRGL